MEQCFLPDYFEPLPEGVEWNYQQGLFFQGSAFIWPSWSQLQQGYQWETYPNWYSASKILENFKKAFPMSHYIRRMEPMEQPAESWSQQMEQQDIMATLVISRAEPNPVGHSDEEETRDLDITTTL
jgi:hypothetical protein